MSAQACEDPSSYLERHRLKARGIDVDCQLCAPSSRPDHQPFASPVTLPVPPPSSPPVDDANEPVEVNAPVSDPSPAWVATTPPTVTKVSSKIEATNSGQGVDLATGEIIGIFVAVLAVFVVILGCIVRSKRADKDQERTFQTQQTNN